MSQINGKVENLTVSVEKIEVKTNILGAAKTTMMSETTSGHHNLSMTVLTPSTPIRS